MRKTLFCLLAVLIFGTAFSCPARASLPIEVMGAVPTVLGFDVSVPAGTSVTAMTLTVSGVEYPTQASVRVGTGNPLIPLDNAHTTGDATSRGYGGIGGPVATQRLTVPLTPFVSSGKVTLYFHFNGTDGTSSGYRVLAFNLLDGNGQPILDTTKQKQDDPNTWTPPLNTPDDISQGQWLWHNATLNFNSLPGAAQMKAHCADCHTSDGRDLKFFNFSNYSIEERAQFHGLSALQGAQIASYIRSLPVPNPGRPWNPPYQPGVGLDSQPVQQWAAGAGLNAALEHDADMVPYLFPAGINKSAVAVGSYLNTREIPLSMPLLVWNQWLPTIHPLDYWGDVFANGDIYARYNKIAARFAAAAAAGNAEAYYLGGFGGDSQAWGQDFVNFEFANIQNIPGPQWTDAMRQGAYSTAQWHTVKMFELMQTYGLEDKIVDYYGPGPHTEPRGWPVATPFETSPHQLHVPGYLHSSEQFNRYTENSWYELQLILNPGNGHLGHFFPVTHLYAYGDIEHCAQSSGIPSGLRLTEYMAKQNQQADLSKLPGDWQGWRPYDADDVTFFARDYTHTLWAGLDDATHKAIYNAMLGAFLDAANTFTPAQLVAGMGITTTDVPNPKASTGDGSARLVDRLYADVTDFQAEGVDPTLVNGMASWSQSLWPNYNWLALVGAAP